MSNNDELAMLYQQMAYIESLPDDERAKYAIAKAKIWLQIDELEAAKDPLREHNQKIITERLDILYASTLPALVEDEVLSMKELGDAEVGVYEVLIQNTLHTGDLESYLEYEKAIIREYKEMQAAYVRFKEFGLGE